MIKGFNIKTIEDVSIKNKRVLLKVDFNVLNLDDGVSINDDTRITNTLPTINKLLKDGNKLIITTHISKTDGPDPKRSTRPIAEHFKQYVPGYTVTFIPDIISAEAKKAAENQGDKEILFLENTRFYPEEKRKSTTFAKKLASFCDVFVFDAFGVAHRVETSVVGVPQYVPSYAGLLVKSEVENIMKAVTKPKRPVVGIVGGAKIESKISAIEKLIEVCDHVLIGGIIGNTFLSSAGIDMGKSTSGYEDIEHARAIYYQAGPLPVRISLPKDVVIGDPKDSTVKPQIVSVKDIPASAYSLDIGPKTRKEFSEIIKEAKTIIWNGPMGLSEQKNYSHGTRELYEAIIDNKNAFSLVGGGDTLNAITNNKENASISHISTGGGATLTLIGKGTLPGLEALIRSQS